MLLSLCSDLKEVYFFINDSQMKKFLNNENNAQKLIMLQSGVLWETLCEIDSFYRGKGRIKSTLREKIGT